MMVRCQNSEAKYLVRALQGKLRIGTAFQTVLVALAHAFSLSPTSSVLKKMSEMGGQEISTLTNQLQDEEQEWHINEEVQTSEEVEVADRGDGKETNLRPREGKKVDATVIRNRIVMDDEDDLKGEGFLPPEVTDGDASAKGESLTAGDVLKYCDSPCTDAYSDPSDLAAASASASTIVRIPSVDMEPEEAVELRRGLAGPGLQRLSRERRLELAVVAVKRAFSECPSISALVDALLQYPLYELHTVCRLRTGIPVAPMLAKPTKKLEEVLQRLSGQLFTMEYKYDGERAQLHLTESGATKIFSRNSEDNTNKYPELADVVIRAKKDDVTSCVLDAEVVAYDREKGCLLPFQILSTRKRKVEEGEEANQKVKVVLQVFDVLLLNGRSLLRLPLAHRRALLHQSFRELEGLFYFARGQDCQENGDTAPIEAFMQEACAAQCEGLMVKTLSVRATYEPSKRSTNWLKLKKDYIEGMGVCDSVDLVPLGGYIGRGKRCQVYGAFLMACYDPDTDEYQSVCKVGTGFKDDDLLRLYEQMKQRVLPSRRKPVNYLVDPVLEPDDWFDLSVVWELAAADLSKSSVHKARTLRKALSSCTNVYYLKRSLVSRLDFHAAPVGDTIAGGVGRLDGSSERGIGLRFPRFLRERPDKKPENATSAEQIVDMYRSQ
eukprot:gene459-486_t